MRHAMDPRNSIPPKRSAGPMLAMIVRLSVRHASVSAVRMVRIPNMDLTEAEIAARAYSYWLERDGEGGTSEDDWNRAINELELERSARS